MIHELSGFQKLKEMYDGLEVLAANDPNINEGWIPAFEEVWPRLTLEEVEELMTLFCNWTPDIFNNAGPDRGDADFWREFMIYYSNSFDGKLQGEIKNLREALQSVIEADKTTYRHHEPRPDGRLPKENGGTIWMTPKEIAQGVLSPHIGG